MKTICNKSGKISRHAFRTNTGNSSEPGQADPPEFLHIPERVTDATHLIFQPVTCTFKSNTELKSLVYNLSGIDVKTTEQDW